MNGTLTPSTDSISPATLGADDEVGFRTISVLSIVSLVLGLASPLAMIAPLLLVLPITGAVLALLAIRRIAVSDGALIGRTAAVIGLVLSVAWASAPLARAAVAKEMLSRQARDVALDWFHLLQQGDAKQAFDLTLASRQASAPANRPGPDGAPVVPPFDAFRADPVVKFLLEHAASAPVHYVRDIAFDASSSQGPRIRQEFTVRAGKDSNGPSDTSIELILQRAREYNDGPWQWLVSAYESDDLASSTN